MISSRLIALDKHPRVRPVEVGKTLRRLMEKCLLQVTVQESKAACRTEQLTGGAEAGIEVGIHKMILM